MNDTDTLCQARQIAARRILRNLFGEPHSRRLHVRLTETEWEQIQALADDFERRISDTVRLGIQALTYLAEHPSIVAPDSENSEKS
jgi:hypothetical protein